MTVTWTKTTLGYVAPEFASITDLEFTTWSEIADKQLSTTRLGDLRDYAGRLLMAHLLCLAKTSTKATGPVSQESVQSVQGIEVSYAVAPLPWIGWNRTEYGRALSELVSATCRGIGSGCLL